MSADLATLTELSREQCLRLLPRVPVGRVGVTIGALPAILPVNFLMVGATVVFRTVPGTKLDAATVRAVVAFEADDHAPDGSWGWSVLVQGVASEITDGPESESIRVGLLRAWAFRAGVADRMVRVDPTFISGRAFGPVVQAMLSGAG